MTTLTGTVVSRYEILELLGTGGMGEVYRARDRDLHRDVAIKFLPQPFAQSPERLARFAHEARTASSLNHPNIITIHEIGPATAGVAPFIVMEYVQGRTLRSLLHDGPLPPRVALDIAVQLADGMAKAHTAGIVHRDLKPENVMVTADGFVKILDFGLAKLRGGVPGPGLRDTVTDLQETAWSPDTVAGALVGTAGYMSPEQARGDHADFHADQFAIGVVLYEMATGRPPFMGPSVVQTLAAIIEEEPEPIAATRPEFPPAARQIATRCLSKAPHARYASTLDLARELRGARDRLSNQEMDVGAPVVAKAWARGRRTWRVAALAAAALGIALLLYLMKGPVGKVLSPLPAERRVAVLPVTVTNDGPGAACCAGLQEYVTGRLAELQRFRAGVIVVPAAEVLDSGARSPSAARRALGANLALGISVHATGGGTLVTLDLSDTAAVRQLRGDSRTFTTASFSPEAIVALAASLLNLELGPEAERRWRDGASQVPEAGAIFAQAIAQTPYQQARSALEQIDQQASLERAIDLFNKAVDLDPRYAAAHAGLAEARLRLFRLTKRADDLELARQSSARALEIDDTRPVAWTTLGMVRSAHGDLAGAEQAFNEAIKRNPAGADAYRELGIAYRRAAAFEKAEAAHRKSVALDPRSWIAYKELAVLLFTRQRFEETEQVLQQALQIAPGNPRLLSNLGATYLSERRWTEADTTLRKAVADQPYGLALSNLGWLQFRVQRQYEEAARTFQRAADASPRDYRVWKNLGDAYRHTTGDRDRGARALEVAVHLLGEERAVNPHDPKIIVELGDCHAMLGHADQARPLLSEARRLAPADGDIAYTAATAYEAIGDREAALHAIAAAVGAGYDLLEIESDTGLERLRADPRYAALTDKHGQPSVRRAP